MDKAESIEEVRVALDDLEKDLAILARVVDSLSKALKNQWGLRIILGRAQSQIPAVSLSKSEAHIFMPLVFHSSDLLNRRHLVMLVANG